MEEKKLFLLDAYALIYRAYYAMIRAPRVTTKGLNTSAIFGFCLTLDDVIGKENPGYMAVCFDPVGGHTFRHDAYAEYKAQRDKQPEDITAAVPYIKRILEAMRIPVIEIENYEADDVIGTISVRAEAEGFTTYMMTPDKDYGQLVTPKVMMYRPALGGKGFEIRGPKEVCDRYGIERTSQVIDILALEGDSSDNIPGCPGVGEKTAAKLIKEWGSIENLLDHVGEVKGAIGAKLAANAEQIRFSKFLATIKTDVPLEIDPESLRRCEPDIDALRALYSELEFRSLTSKLNSRYDSGGREEISQSGKHESRGAMGSLFDDGDATSEPDGDNAFTVPAVKTVDTPRDAAAVLTLALQQPTVGFDLDAPGEDAMSDPIRGFSVAWNDEVCYFPMPDFEMERRELLVLLEPLMSATRCTIVCHDVKRAMVMLKRSGVEWTAPYFDTSVAHYLLQPEMKHDLATVAYTFLNYRTSDYELSTNDRKKEARLETPDMRARSSAERAFVAKSVYEPLLKAMKEGNVYSLFCDIDAPFIPVLAGMEYTGVCIDVKELAAISRALTARLSELERKAFDIAGGPFNISSPMQVGEVLFGRLGIDPNAKKTKRGTWSTTEEVLEKYAPQHPIVGLILEIRGVRKLLATYVDALPKLINPRTGKIHTTFNQIVTATGRISSANPNLQNIPIRTEEGREIRRAIVPDPGCLLMSADYSQIELRLMADLSADPAMLEAFNSGEDIHRATAAKIFGKTLSEVTDNERRHAKTANFGIIYGISAFGLSQRLGISRSDAKAIIDGLLRTYPGMQAYMDGNIASARDRGYVTTVMGRKRFLPDINSRNAALRGYAERNAVNAPLQGSAADIIKLAMIRIDREISRRGLRSRMIVQVHDELVFNVVPDELDELRALVVDNMESAYSGKVKLEVSCGVGHNWLEAH